MTGEMGWNDLKEYPDMLALAKKIQSGAKVAAQVRPFDVYQGPFIAVDLDGAPVRNAQKTQFGSWNLEVWYGDQAHTFYVKWGSRSMDHLSERGVIQLIKDIKYGIPNKVITKSKTKRK
jgi:hypothetical protein